YVRGRVSFSGVFLSCRSRHTRCLSDWSSDVCSSHLQHPRIGVVLMPGIQAHGTRSRTPIPRNLLFAREIMTTSGRQVIAIADERSEERRVGKEWRRGGVPALTLKDVGGASGVRVSSS